MYHEDTVKSAVPQHDNCFVIHKTIEMRELAMQRMHDEEDESEMLLRKRWDQEYAWKVTSFQQEQRALLINLHKGRLWLVPKVCPVEMTGPVCTTDIRELQNQAQEDRDAPLEDQKPNLPHRLALPEEISEGDSFRTDHTDWLFSRPMGPHMRNEALFRTVYVYLCGDALDMHPELDYLHREVFPDLQRRVFASRIRLVPVDCRIATAPGPYSFSIVRNVCHHLVIFKV